jgi:hypothetical protein
MSKHSTGPWSVWPDGTSIFAADGTLIAHVEHDAANARLIATAPRMFAVLEGLENWSDPEGAFQAEGHRDAVRAVLAEVRGAAV